MGIYVWNQIESIRHQLLLFEAPPNTYLLPYTVVCCKENMFSNIERMMHAELQIGSENLIEQLKIGQKLFLLHVVQLHKDKQAN